MIGSTGTLTFNCSICSEPSHDICVYCTKDVCRLHRCQRCLRCSDCCECESPLCLDEEPVAQGEEPVVEEAVARPAGEAAMTEPVAEPTESEATAPDPASLDGHLPGTSTNGSW